MTNHGEEVEALMIAVNQRASSRKTTESNMLTESEEVYSTDEEADFAFGAACFGKASSKGQSSQATAATHDEVLEAMAAEFQNSGQSHLLAFVDQLSEVEKAQLIKQLSSINPVATNSLYNSSMQEDDLDSADDFKVSPSLTVPNKAAIFAVPAVVTPPMQDCITIGNEIIKDGKVALVLFATESAECLDSDETSKGLFKLGLPSQKTVFQLAVERYLRVQQVAHGVKKMPRSMQNCKIVIITSLENHT